MEQREMNRDSIDIVKLVNVLLKRKWWIILGTLCVIIAAVVISFTLPKVYRSEGFIQLSDTTLDMNIDELKSGKTENGKDNPNTMLLNETIILNQLLLLNQTLEGGSLMTKSMTIPDYKRYYPQFTDRRRFKRYKETRRTEVQISTGISQGIEPIYAYNKKDLNDLGQISKDAPNFIVGVKVFSEQPSSKTANMITSIFGDYIREVILNGKLTDYILIQLKKTRAYSKENEVEDVKYTFFQKAWEEMKQDKIGIGTESLDRLRKLLNAMTPEKEQVKNEIGRDLDIMSNRCESIRFVSEPTLPSGPIKPNKPMILAISFVLGFFFFVALVFFIEWWQINGGKNDKR